MSAAERKSALLADAARFATAIANCNTEIQSRQDQIDANAPAVSARSTAAALGTTFAGDVLTPTEIGILEQEIEGYRSALKQLTAQKESVEATLKQAELDVRRELAAYVRQTILPPLLTDAQAAGEKFGRALALLAAAEDKSIELGRPQREPCGHGNAARFVDAVNEGTGRNEYFDVGPGRGVWDLPDYRPARSQIEAQLREVGA